jgi:hypothetical protein
MLPRPEDIFAVAYIKPHATSGIFCRPEFRLVRELPPGEVRSSVSPAVKNATANMPHRHRRELI